MITIEILGKFYKLAKQCYLANELEIDATWGRYNW
jgi:hypothetical protein